jgi:hypothetical protein
MPKRGSREKYNNSNNNNKYNVQYDDTMGFLVDRFR